MVQVLSLHQAAMGPQVLDRHLAAMVPQVLDLHLETRPPLVPKLRLVVTMPPQILELRLVVTTAHLVQANGIHNEEQEKMAPPVGDKIYDGG